MGIVTLLGQSANSLRSCVRRNKFGAVFAENFRRRTDGQSWRERWSAE